jgi:P63C domain
MLAMEPQVPKADKAKKTSNKAKGGIARAEKLSPQERSKIAQKGAEAKKANASLPSATHIGELPIGEMLLSCAVLPDGTRVISQATIGSAFGPVVGGWQMRKMKDSGGLPPFLVAGTLQPFISDELRTLVASPIKYKDPRGGAPRYGYEAVLLPRLCEVWLKAREAGALTKIQEPVALRAEILTRALANTGIIALVDETTGYQEDRAKDALSKILEEFIAKELQPWVSTFPAEFYKELFRLRGLEYSPDSVKRPQYFGLLTNDIVYKRLAPGVLVELKKVTPKNDKGKLSARLFQSLTGNTGYPKLKEHLGKVVAYMQLSDTYEDFRHKLDRLLPKYDETISLNFDDENEGM